MQPHPHYAGKEAGVLANEIKRVLDQIQHNLTHLDHFNFTYLNPFNQQLNQFIAQYQPIEKFKIEQLSNQHHNPINQLEAINNTLRQSGVFSILSPSINIPQLEKELNELKGHTDVIVKEAQDNAEIIRGLIPDATATSLSVAIDDRAKSLKKTVGLWLVAVVTVLILISIFSWNFLQVNGSSSDGALLSNNNNSKVLDSLTTDSTTLNKIDSINTQAANTPESYTIVYWIKRIVVFAPLFYLIVFCIRQYNKERKLLEIYIHKKTISQTLPAYMKQAQKEDIMDEILLRGSSMIFTLPENPDSPIQGSDGIAINELKSFLDVKDKLK